MRFMTGETIFLDSSVFIAFFVNGIDPFRNLENCRLVTAINVIEEVAYVLVKECARVETNIEKHYDLLHFLRNNPELVSKISREVISDISAVLDAFNVFVFPPASFSEMFEVMLSYGLLPNDALIAATCKHYGIKKIATFDEDFKRIDFLEVVEI